jgi:hypothetical protein
MVQGRNTPAAADTVCRQVRRLGRGAPICHLQAQARQEEGRQKLVWGWTSYSTVYLKPAHKMTPLLVTQFVHCNQNPPCVQRPPDSSRLLRIKKEVVFSSDSPSSMSNRCRLCAVAPSAHLIHCFYFELPKKRNRSLLPPLCFMGFSPYTQSSLGAHAARSQRDGTSSWCCRTAWYWPS